MLDSILGKPQICIDEVGFSGWSKKKFDPSFPYVAYCSGV